MNSSLYFREGTSDKEYHAAIEPKDGGYLVTFAYGRRGPSLQTGTKTPEPVSLEAARAIFDKLFKSKIAKGYRPAQTTDTPHAAPRGDLPAPDTDTGIRCQLLNPVDETDLPRLLSDRAHILQPKLDGRRLLVRQVEGQLQGINRRGLAVALPEPIRDAVTDLTGDLPGNLLLDGEAVGATYHVFDILELEYRNLRDLPYLERHQTIVHLLGTGWPALRYVPAAITPEDKHDTFHEIKATGGEGVVFKRADSPYTPGRPNSGGPHLKFKFVESASFLCAGRNGTRRSIALEIIDDTTGHRLNAGNVTIPANHDVPPKGSVVDVRYLYAYPGGATLCQPVYLAPRPDLTPEDCILSQLKFKT